MIPIGATVARREIDSNHTSAFAQIGGLAWILPLGVGKFIDNARRFGTV
jgi:hypothetical protein